MNQNDNVEQAPQPQLCANNCGFFASSAGLCSKCFRDSQLKQQQQQAVTMASVTPASASSSLPVAAKFSEPVAIPAADAPSSSGTESVAASPAAPASGSPAKSGPTRCAHPECRKKVGLTGFKCKCDQVFCGAHRYAESHACPFDYKESARQKLAAQNPLVAAAKVQKI